ncbi:transglutaminase N-terminal domain-containing protein, partial [Burkholderia humptydooensis]
MTKQSPANAKTGARARKAAVRAEPARGALLRVTHDTRYRYAARVESAQHQARLRPLETPRQRVLEFSLEIDPRAEGLVVDTDSFGNER